MFRSTLNSDSSSTDQVENQNDQSHNEKKVNETAGYVKAETQQPQQQNDNKDCPEHTFSLTRMGAREESNPLVRLWLTTLS